MFHYKISHFGNDLDNVDFETRCGSMIFGLQLELENKLHETTELSDKVTILDEKVAGAQEECKGYLSLFWCTLNFI